jgi:uncharacterized protein YbjT (DUF2867 family)
MCMPQALSAEAMCAYGEAVVDAAIDSGVEWLVRISSFGIDGVPSQGPLGAAHCNCEEYCRKKGLGFTSVRPTSFSSNFATFDAPSIASESVFRSPLGETACVNWVHCADIGNVAAELLARPPSDRLTPEALAEGHEVVDVTGPASSTLSAPAMAELLSAELGRKVRYEEVPAPPVEEYRALWRFLRAGGFARETDQVLRITVCLVPAFSPHLSGCARRGSRAASRRAEPALICVSRPVLTEVGTVRGAGGGAARYAPHHQRLPRRTRSARRLGSDNPVDRKASPALRGQDIPKADMEKWYDGPLLVLCNRSHCCVPCSAHPPVAPA